jgi:hypothetical protein
VPRERTRNDTSAPVRALRLTSVTTSLPMRMSGCSVWSATPSPVGEKTARPYATSLREVNAPIPTAPY